MPAEVKASTQFLSTSMYSLHCPPHTQSLLEYQYRRQAIPSTTSVGPKSKWKFKFKFLREHTSPGNTQFPVPELLVYNKIQINHMSKYSLNFLNSACNPSNPPLLVKWEESAAYESFSGKQGIVDCLIAARFKFAAHSYEWLLAFAIAEQYYCALSTYSIFRVSAP